MRSDLNWAGHVNYTVKNVWKAHFIRRIFKKGNSSTKSLAYTTQVLPILECGVVCWDPYRERQILYTITLITVFVPTYSVW